MHKQLRYQVLDEDGEVLRAFPTKHEALWFMHKELGETLRVLPKPPKFNPYENYEEALL